MAYTAGELTTIITTLETSLAKGTAEVVFEGRRLAYRSVDEILKAIAYFKGLLDGVTATAEGITRVRRLLPYTDKAL